MGASIFLLSTLLAFTFITVKCQITTPCTVSMIRGFTPCVNYLTGSSANGKSPSATCCDAMESLMTTSMDCTCLLVTGNVPFSLPSPINQALAISLPQLCNSTNMALQCKASGVSLPPPGPMLFAPPPKAFTPIGDPPEFAPSPNDLETMAVTLRRSEMIPDVSTNAPEPFNRVTQLTRRVGSSIQPVVAAGSVGNPLSISLISVLVVILTICYNF